MLRARFLAAAVATALVTVTGAARAEMSAELQAAQVAKADAGDAQAQWVLGNLLIEEHRLDEGLGWIRRAAEHGFASAQVTLAEHYRTGDGLPKDEALAEKWSLLAAAGGDRHALQQLARLAEARATDPASMAFAESMWQEAAENNDAEALVRVARYALLPGRPAKERARVIPWLERAIEMNQAPARMLLAQVLLRGDCGKPDPVAAYFHFCCAAEGGQSVSRELKVLERELSPAELSAAQLKVSKWCETREQGGVAKVTYAADGTPQYDSHALKWYLRAVEKGDLKLKLEAADLLGRGAKWPRLPVVAERLYKQAIATGDAGAKRDYGIYLLKKKETDAGLKWLETAAVAGDEKAISHLALCYIQGDDGVPRDVVAGMKWFKIMASHGDRYAASSLAKAYKEGRGLPMDDEASRRWLVVAAENADPSSAYDIGRRYEKGEGYAKDLVAAYQWFLIAKRDHFVCGEVGMARLAPMLSTAELAKAIGDADAWWAAHPKAHFGGGISTSGCS